MRTAAVHEGDPNFDSVLGRTMKAYEKDLMENIYSKNITLEAIKKMDMGEYAKVREQLMGTAKGWREEEAVNHTCMWCGTQVSGDIDAHEAECGA